MLDKGHASPSPALLLPVIRQSTHVVLVGSGGIVTASFETARRVAALFRVGSRRTCVRHSSRSRGLPVSVTAARRSAGRSRSKRIRSETDLVIGRYGRWFALASSTAARGLRR